MTPPDLGNVALSTEVSWACGHKGVSLIGNASTSVDLGAAQEAMRALKDGCSQVPCWLCRVEERTKSPPQDPLFVQKLGIA